MRKRMKMIELAEHYARIMHTGQKRDKNNLPYVVHPEHVVQYLRQLGIKDETTLAIAWLHDVIEDTSMTYDDIKLLFGREVAEGVYLLTRNVDRNEYKKRLRTAPYNVQLVKLCDTLDNVSTLDCLEQHSIERKINDCLEFYIPLARELSPKIERKMKEYLEGYLVRQPDYVEI